MPSASVVTSVSSITLICDYSTSISGNYPNVNFVFNYSFKLNLSNSASYISGVVTFNFHTNNHKVTLPYISGPTTSSVLASGSLTLPFGSGRTCTHVPGYGISFSWGGGGSSTLSASQSIPAPAITANLKNVSAKSVSLEINMTSNPNSFYQVDVWRTDRIVPSVKLGSAVQNGVFVDNSPEPEKAYLYSVETWCKSFNPDAYITRSLFEVTTLPDQASIWFKENGEWMNGKLWFKKNGEWVKVKKVYIKQNSGWNAS